VQDKLIPLCKLYENTSKTTGKRYFVGNLSFTSKLLIFQDEDAKDGGPQWTVFIAEWEQKPATSQVSTAITRAQRPIAAECPIPLTPADSPMPGAAPLSGQQGVWRQGLIASC